MRKAALNKHIIVVAGNIVSSEPQMPDWLGWSDVGQQVFGKLIALHARGQSLKRQVADWREASSWWHPFGAPRARSLPDGNVDVDAAQNKRHRRDPIRFNARPAEDNAKSSAFWAKLDDYWAKSFLAAAFGLPASLVEAAGSGRPFYWPLAAETELRGAAAHLLAGMRNSARECILFWRRRESQSSPARFEISALVEPINDATH